MRTSIQILSVILLLTLVSVASAQSTQTCGITGIDGPSELEPGSPLVLKAKITGPIHTTKPEFKWKLSAGTITAGQGTDEITVDSVGLGGLEVTVTVELVGALVGCSASASRLTRVNPAPITCGRPFDSYGNIKFEDEEARLDNFAIQLQNGPDSSGSLHVSAGPETYENESTERLRRAKSYLVDVRGIDPNRLVTVDCGYAQELWTQLYIVPLGATFPECTNQPIPFSQVKFTKRPPSPKKQR